MKYIIKEEKINNTIKNFIMEKFPMVYDVKFKKYKKVLGSTDGQPIVGYTLINVIFNNSENKYSYSDLDMIAEDISKIDSVFGLGLFEYGSEWEVGFSQLAIVELKTKLIEFK